MSELTNGRYTVPVPLVYIDELTDIPVRVRRPNRRTPAMRFVRIPKAWR